jgi:hypothetical protein
MPRISKPLSRFAVALGGFLIFVGIIVVGFVIIGILDPTLFESESLQSFRNLPLMLLFTVGLLDLMAGFLLRPR